ncbi:HEPN domain-containing protein [Acidianus sp. HS-5]|uniref:HEPN domain-containing protein n=1 Tax=Acidianus sp. HS-5 TaxID=2886040 RepID=UPI001F19EA0F|nr:HEPN domain-containing protein [Acidianus sp. HS-5]BDC17441.1 hypothetical protein HS5_03310 [Acidianus sp. HS-5]
MGNKYISCAELFLEEAKRDLEAAELLYNGKYEEQSLFYLQQANEKSHKAFRCIIQYLFQSLPEGIGKCLKSKLNRTSPYYAIIYASTYHIKQFKIDDIEEFFKNKYSHDTVKGYYEELEEFTREFKFLKNVLLFTLSSISENVAKQAEILIKIIMEKIISEEIKELKDYLNEDNEENTKNTNTQYNKEEEYIKKIFEYNKVLSDKTYLAILNMLLSILSSLVISHIITTFDEKRKAEFNNYFTYIVEITSYSLISYKLLIILNLLLNNYAEISRYPDIKNGKSTKSRIPSYISQNLKLILDSSKFPLDFIERLFNFIKDIDSKFGDLCKNLHQNNITEIIKRLDEFLSTNRINFSSLEDIINALSQKLKGS